MPLLILFFLCVFSNSASASVTDNDMKKGYMAWVVIHGELKVSEYTAKQCNRLDKTAGRLMQADIRSWKRQEYHLFQQLNNFEVRLNKTLNSFSDQQKERLTQQREKMIQDRVDVMVQKFAVADEQKAIHICKKMQPMFVNLLDSLKSQHQALYQHMLVTQW